jgi:hypothetical protein
VQFAWAVMSQLLGRNWRATNFAQLHAILSSFLRYLRRILWILFLAQSWTLWNTRNKLTIEKKIVNHPADIIYKINCHFFAALVYQVQGCGKRR